MQKNQNLLLLVPCSLAHKIRVISTKTKKKKFSKGEKLGKKTLLELVQVNVPNIFYFDEIWKTRKLWPKALTLFVKYCKKCMFLGNWNSNNWVISNYFFPFYELIFFSFCTVFCATESSVPIRASSDFFLHFPLVFWHINHNDHNPMFWLPWSTLLYIVVVIHYVFSVLLSKISMDFNYYDLLFLYIYLVLLLNIFEKKKIYIHILIALTYIWRIL